MILNKGVAEFMGFEFATFKLKTGVSEQQLLALVKEVDDQFLSREAGLLGHFVLKAGDGSYAEVALATTQQRAEELCQLWLHNETALKYLELLDHESVDMTFWTRIS